MKTDCQILNKDSSSVRTTIETLLEVGLSMASYHAHRSNKDVSILNSAKMGIAYGRVQKLTNQIANNADINLGAYVPPELKKGLPMRASLDNIDRKVDTVDGKMSFHGTAITLYQRPMSDPDANMYLTQEVHLSQESTKFVRNVPQTIVALQPCDIQERPKPANSPHYEHYKIGEHREELQKDG